MAERFTDGDLALAIDRRGRRYLIKLGMGKVFESHLGYLPHEEIIGNEEGCRLPTHSGHEIVLLKPGLADYILEMPRQSQVIYPKDIGPILLHADIYPGATVVEAGNRLGRADNGPSEGRRPFGSRRLPMKSARTWQHKAMLNIQAFLPGVETLLLRHGDIYEGIVERDVDRIALDLPEPWRAVGVAAEALRTGGAADVLSANGAPGPPALRDPGGRSSV